MMPLVDLARSAESIALARELAVRVRRNVLGHPAVKRDFDRLRGSVAVVAHDTTVVLTLRFDHGRMVIHQGIVGVPDVTFRGDEATLRKLTDIPFARWVALPLPGLRRAPWAVLRALQQARRDHRLTVYGFWFHLPLLLRLGRLVSAHGAAAT